MAWFSPRIKSEDYIAMLEISSIEHGKSLLSPDYVFQQNATAILNSKLTKARLADKNIADLEWPTCSPDLNPTENLFSILYALCLWKRQQIDNISEENFSRLALSTTHYNVLKRCQKRASKDASKGCQWKATFRISEKSSAQKFYLFEKSPHATFEFNKTSLNRPPKRSKLERVG